MNVIPMSKIKKEIQQMMNMRSTSIISSLCLEMVGHDHHSLSFCLALKPQCRPLFSSQMSMIPSMTH